MDDNNRKPICRLRFNATKQKYLGLFDADKNEEKIPIDSVADIYKYSDRLRATAVGYIAELKQPRWQVFIPLGLRFYFLGGICSLERFGDASLSTRNSWVPI